MTNDDLRALKLLFREEMRDLERHLDARLDVRDQEFDKLAGELVTIRGLLGDDQMWRTAIDAMGTLNRRLEAVEDQTRQNAEAHRQTRAQLRWLFAGLVVALAFLVVMIGQHIYLIRHLT